MFCSWTTPGTYARDSPGAAALTQLYLGPMRRLAEAGIVSVGPAGDDGVDIDADPTRKFPVVLQTELKLTVAAIGSGRGSTSQSNYGRGNADLAAPELQYSTVPILLGYQDTYNGEIV